MKAGFYPRLAFDGIRKNKRLYLPYIMACSVMAAVFYIIVFLRHDAAVLNLFGEDLIVETLSLGSIVIACFACVFMFYTNSFLMRRRKKEFGLYNILGMGKRSLVLIVSCETVTVAAASVAIGLAAGITLSKLAELLLVNLLKGSSVDYSFKIDAGAIAQTAAVFSVIFLLILLNSVRQIIFSTSISLLRAENFGEKPPKANWLFGIAGLVLLAAAYYIAVTITSPITALVVFFFAVLMVIAGTYLIMISGSVMFCRILQKIKGYYYRPNHFVSVSSMAYRMKRNGAGLASICILSTMVLVMISSTTSLYFGMEYALGERYPREVTSSVIFESESVLNDESLAPYRKAAEDISNKYGFAPTDTVDYRTGAVVGYLENGTVETDAGVVDYLDAKSIDKGVCQFYFVPLDDYNRMFNTREKLDSKEVMIYMYRGSYDLPEITFNNGETLKIVKRIDYFPTDGDAAMSILPTMVIISKDLEDALGGLLKLADYSGGPLVSPSWIYGFNAGVPAEEQINVMNELYSRFKEISPDRRCHTECVEDSRAGFYGLYGGLFFLGVMLSAVFIIAAVLIIYYKQLAEGYEDQPRFGIMQKVGMTDREIRRSINSQLLTVFFLPLILAATHLLFAFPIINKILLLFNLAASNATLYGIVTVICFAVFALMYSLVYKITSNTYYRIVTGGRERTS